MLLPANKTMTHTEGKYFFLLLLNDMRHKKTNLLINLFL